VNSVQALAKDLAAVVGRRGVLTAPADLLPYESDALPFQRLMPGMVVLPESAEQVAAVVRLLARSHLPFLARGSGTSLSGSSVAVEGAVVICLSRMNRILEVDLLNRFVVVEAGCVNKTVSDAVAPSGWQFAPDPSSQAVCTIGGNIAHNAGGPHTLKHGVTANHVLSLELVLPDGEVIRAGSVCECAPGYDLRGVIIGSEGMTGIVTRAALRLTRLPQAVRTALALFDSIDKASQAATAVIAAAIVPGALEMIDNLMLRAFEAAYHVGLPVDAAAVVVLEVEGLEATVDEDLEKALAVLRGHGAFEARTAKDEAERQALWKVRKSAGGSLGRFTPSYYTLDGCVPRSRIAEALRTLAAIGEKYGIPVGNAFHAGDGNLHPFLIYDDRVPVQRERVLQAAHEMLAACVAMGGTITGEHGVGLEKTSLISQMFTRHDLAAMRAVRRAFDPLERCNPGKVFPEQGEPTLVPPAGGAPQPPAASQVRPAVAGIVGRTQVVFDEDRGEAVASPGSIGQVAQLLEWAHRSGVAVVPRGGGTATPLAVWPSHDRSSPLMGPFRIPLGPFRVPEGEDEGGGEIPLTPTLPHSGGRGTGGTVRAEGFERQPAAGLPESRVGLSLARLNSVVHYEPADLVITAQAGITIAALQQVLASGGQFLPIDPPFADRATLGGVIAANSAGPLRCAHGTVRDLLAQMRAVLAGGALIRSGAPCVKNSAGLDLGRLFTGSFGTLGVIVEATLRVLPLPESEVAFAASFSDVSRAAQAAVRVRCSDAEPRFLELLGPAMASADLVGRISGKYWLAVGTMGSRKSVALQSDRVRAILADEGAESIEQLPSAGLRERLAQLHCPDGTSCRVSVPPASLGMFLWQTEAAAPGPELRYICHAGSGIADLRLEDGLPTARILSLLETLRSSASDCAGSLLLTGAPAAILERFHPWSSSPSGFEVMRTIKQSLDPRNIMNPGALCRGL